MAVLSIHLHISTQHPETTNQRQHQQYQPPPPHSYNAAGSAQAQRSLPLSCARGMDMGVALFQAHAKKQQQTQGGEECAHPAPACGHPEALQCCPGCCRKDGPQGWQARPPESQAQGTGCTGGSRATAAAAGTGNMAGTSSCPLAGLFQGEDLGPPRAGHTFSVGTLCPLQQRAWFGWN